MMNIMIIKTKSDGVMNIQEIYDEFKITKFYNGNGVSIALSEMTKLNRDFLILYVYIKNYMKVGEILKVPSQHRKSTLENAKSEFKYIFKNKWEGF